MRLSLTLACHMDFTSYPFDWQVCPLELESYGYKTDHIMFDWDTNLPPIDIKPGLKLPNYRVRGHLVEKKSKAYLTGNFTCISGRWILALEFYFCLAYFIFDRLRTYYLLQMYIPTAMIVLVSWISFFVPIELAAPRTTLNITTVLTSTTMWMSIER